MIFIITPTVHTNVIRVINSLVTLVEGWHNSEMGIRFHPTRGAMSLGQSAGGLPPDKVCEQEPEILVDMERCINEFHDNSRYASLAWLIPWPKPLSPWQNHLHRSIPAKGPCVFCTFMEVLIVSCHEWRPEIEIAMLHSPLEEIWKRCPQILPTF